MMIVTRNPIILIVILLTIFGAKPSSAFQKKVVITVDDLPGTHGELYEYEFINNALVSFFDDHSIPAIGFINESKLYIDDQPDSNYIDLLKLWLERDLELGNHTFSHPFINQTPVEQYKSEILRGEIITRPLLEQYGKKLKYFRHTQLRTGPTDEYRIELNNFLELKNYITAPVTIDNDEYIYALRYREAQLANNPELMSLIGKDYLSYMEEIVDYYEELSDEFLGYNVPQILLIHANRLNADYISKLMHIFIKRGYSFIDLDEALMDQAFANPIGMHRRGLSWIHRWMIQQDLEPKPQPPVSDFILSLN